MGYTANKSYLPWTDANIKTVPEVAGVYVLRSGDGKIGYIGSAGTGRLRARLLEHRNQNTHPKTASFDWYQTASEDEARKLETAWITKHAPPWNKTVP